MAAPETPSCSSQRGGRSLSAEDAGLPHQEPPAIGESGSSGGFTSLEKTRGVDVPPVEPRTPTPTPRSGEKACFPTTSRPRVIHPAPPSQGRSLSQTHLFLNRLELLKFDGPSELTMITKPDGAEPLSPTSPDPNSPTSQSDSLELDSPPKVTMITKPDCAEPLSPTSPDPNSPTSPDPNSPTSPEPNSPSNPAVFPKAFNVKETDEEDPYFKHLVDSFIDAAITAQKSAPTEEEITAAIQQKSDLFAEIALKQYNNENKIKYALINVIESSGIMEEHECYSHMNFIARGNQEDSKEEIFFAELRRHSCDKTYTAICVLPLQGEDVGGLCDTKYDNFKYKSGEKGLPIDNKHCYACGKNLKHPKKVLYKAGHVATSEYYHE